MGTIKKVQIFTNWSLEASVIEKWVRFLSALWLVRFLEGARFKSWSIVKKRKKVDRMWRRPRDLEAANHRAPGPRDQFPVSERERRLTFPETQRLTEDIIFSPERKLFIFHAKCIILRNLTFCRFLTDFSFEFLCQNLKTPWPRKFSEFKIGYCYYLKFWNTEINQLRLANFQHDC